MTKMSPAVTRLLNRGVAQVLPDRDSLANLMATKKIKLYLGIDPTGDLLHLGHSVVLRKLQQFVAAGHEVNLLVGSGTAKIGDPTGRDSTRPELTDEQIAKNFASWQAQASKIIDFSKVKIVYNGDWLGKLDYADMIKLLATTTMSQLLERDMFQERIKNNLPIFGHEIIYPLMQGYDSVALDVDLEIGGTDQTFNMMMGRHLQRVYNNREKWVLTTPLINGLDGRKMSKSYGNFVALTEPANEMYGKIMSARDEVLIDYFTLLTDRSDEEIETMRAAIADGANPMLYKKILAHDITAFYHDKQAADEAAKNFELTVQEKALPRDLPIITVPNGEIKLKDLLKICLPNESMSNLKRLVEQGGVEIYDFEEPLTPDAVLMGRSLDERVLRAGKRAFFKLETKE